MPHNLGVFFCDLSPLQKREAKETSTNRGALARGATSFQLNLIGPEPNLKWKLDSRSLEKGQKGEILKNPMAEDLLAFAAHLYQADRLLKRPETPLREWSREIELHVGVQEEELWNRKASDLANLLRDLTHDQFRLFFYHRDDPRPELKLLSKAPPVEGGICVFSTHFKSVFGIACQSESGDLIASVLYGPGGTKSSQDELISEISRVTNPFRFIAFRLIPVGLPAVERTDRTIGFLQLALAAGLARHLGLKRIQLFDDAISCYHLRQRQICGPGLIAVRDSRPDFLWQARNVFRELLTTGDLEIQNPFQFYTATQILECLGRNVPQDPRGLLLQKTDSCLDKDLAKALRSQWNGAVPHCGCCFPCKLRRLAALDAGLETCNAYDAYAIDPLSLSVPSQVLDRLSDNLRRRVKDYHSNGLPLFKSYLENFQTGSPADWQSGIDVAIKNLSSEKFFLGISPPGELVTQVTAATIFKWIVDVHARFARVLRFF